jgi:hypothetical protein
MKNRAVEVLLTGYMINDRAKKAIFQQIDAEPLILPAQECLFLLSITHQLKEESGLN